MPTTKHPIAIPAIAPAEMPWLELPDEPDVVELTDGIVMICSLAPATNWV